MDLLQLLAQARDAAGGGSSSDDSNDKTKHIFYRLKRMCDLKYKTDVQHRLKHLNIAIRCLDEGPAEGFDGNREESLEEMKRCRNILQQVGGKETRQELQELLNQWGDRYFRSKILKSTRLCGKVVQYSIMFRDMQQMLQDIPIERQVTQSKG